MPLPREVGRLASSRIASRFGAKPRPGDSGNASQPASAPREPLEDLLAHEQRDVVILDQSAVRQPGVQVHVVMRPRAAVRDADVECRRHPGDPRDLREPAADHHVRLQQVDRVREDEVAEAEREPLVLPGAERDAGLASEVGHYAHVVLRHRLLEERDVVRLDAARELERVVAVEAAVRVDEELHAGADRFADRPHARDVLRDHRRERARLVATLERVMADDHLEPRVTVGDP